MASTIAILYNDDLNGVTTVNYAVLKKLKEAHSHDVSVYFMNKTAGGFAYKFAQAGISVLDELSGTYDRIILNNREGLRYHVGKADTVPSGKRIFMVHSLMNPESSIPPLNENLTGFQLDVYTFSERGKDYLETLGHSPTLVTNAIDLTRFTTGAAPAEVKKILVLDVRNSTFYQNKIVSLSALMPQVYFRFITLPTWEIEAEIAAADMVIAYGRSAIESMAKGKPTIIYGVNGGDGLVTDTNKAELAKTNFSGWTYRSLPTPENLTEMELLAEIAKFNGADAEAVRDYIRTNYDISDLATSFNE